MNFDNIEEKLTRKILKYRIKRRRLLRMLTTFVVEINEHYLVLIRTALPEICTTLV